MSISNWGFWERGHVRKADGTLAGYERYRESRFKEGLIPAGQGTTSVRRLRERYLSDLKNEDTKTMDAVMDGTQILSEFHFVL